MGKAEAGTNDLLRGGTQPGAFPVHNTRDFGAAGDGATLDTEALQAAVDRAGADGGGWVYVPPGDYRTGALRLRPRVTLYVEAGATLWGSKDREQYDPETEVLIYAEDAPDVALRGRGVIDGNGPAFWKRNEQGFWRHGDWRPRRMMQLVRCHNLLIEGITFRNSPCWTIHPVDCDRVLIDGISILNGVTKEDKGPNTDGIDPDGCTRVRIANCCIQTGDDSIVLKITDRPGGSRVCRDVVVTNCVLHAGPSALKIGSETHGEFRNIVFANCAVRDAGNGIGLWMRDGGLIDGFLVHNVSMTLTGGGQPIYFWSYRRKDEAVSAGTVRNVVVSNVVAEADGCVFMSGSEEAPLENVTLDNVRLFMRGAAPKEHHADPPHPFRVWGYRVSPYDVFCRYVKGLRLRDVQVTWNEPEDPAWGSAVRCRHVEGLEIRGFEGRQAAGSEEAALDMRHVRAAWVHQCRAPEGTGTFLHLGEGCRDAGLTHSDLGRAQCAVSLDAGVDADELFECGNRPPRTGRE